MARAKVKVDGDALIVVADEIPNVAALKEDNLTFATAMLTCNLVSHSDMTLTAPAPADRHTISGVYEPVENAPQFVLALLEAGWAVETEGVYEITDEGHGRHDPLDLHFVDVRVRGPRGNELHRIRVTLERDVAADHFRAQSDASTEVPGFWEAFSSDALGRVRDTLHRPGGVPAASTKTLQTMSLAPPWFKALAILVRA